MRRCAALEHKRGRCSGSRDRGYRERSPADAAGAQTPRQTDQELSAEPSSWPRWVMSQSAPRQLMQREPASRRRIFGQLTVPKGGLRRVPRVRSEVQQDKRRLAQLWRERYRRWRVSAAQPRAAVGSGRSCDHHGRCPCDELHPVQMPQVEPQLRVFGAERAAGDAAVVQRAGAGAASPW